VTDVITKPEPLRCEGKHYADKPKAHYYGMRTKGEGSVPVALCGVHANSDKRWYGRIERIDAEVESVIRERLAAEKARKAEAAAAVRAESEARQAKRIEREWAEVPTPYEMALVIEDPRWEGALPDIFIVVRPVGSSADTWDHVRVVLHSEGPGAPTYARIRAGSPADLTPSAASVLADALALVGVWAEQANA
jgi:hypothetical protein